MMSWFISCDVGTSMRESILDLLIVYLGSIPEWEFEYMSELLLVQR